MKLIENFKNIEMEISKEKGAFSLFALVLREDSQEKWDLLISAPWLLNDQNEIPQKKSILFYFVDKISKIDKSLLNELSRIILLLPNDPFVTNMNSIVKAEHKMTEFRSCTFNNIYIKHAFIITSQKVNP